MTCNVANRQRCVRFAAEAARELARGCAPEEWRGGVVNIVICADAEIIALNRRFLGRSGPTDVLAFPLESGSRPGRVIGDVYVNAEHAREEARLRGVSPRAELAMYIAHGLLHLAGYDDHSRSDRARMYAREREALESAGWMYARWRLS